MPNLLAESCRNTSQGWMSRSRSRVARKKPRFRLKRAGLAGQERTVLWRAGDSRADPHRPRASTAKCEAVNCNTQPILNRSHISEQTGTRWRTFSRAKDIPSSLWQHRAIAPTKTSSSSLRSLDRDVLGVLRAAAGATGREP